LFVLTTVRCLSIRNQHPNGFTLQQNKPIVVMITLCLSDATKEILP
jgi:hypothetical protein